MGLFRYAEMWGLESEGGWGGWLGGCGAMQMMQWEDDALVRRAREIVSEQWPRLENNEIDARSSLC